MSVADRIGREAQEFLALEDADYSVQIQHATSFGWFYLRVFYRDKLIYERACCKSYRMARRRIRHVVRHHKRLVAALKGSAIRYGPP